MALENITREMALSALIRIGGKIEGIALEECSELEKRIYNILKELGIMGFECSAWDVEIRLTPAARNFKLEGKLALANRTRNQIGE